jgi:hypothetical protein
MHGERFRRRHLHLALERHRCRGAHIGHAAFGVGNFENIAKLHARRFGIDGGAGACVGDRVLPCGVERLGVLVEREIQVMDFEQAGRGDGGHDVVDGVDLAGL